MRCLVIYFSQTGNTKKIARAIKKGIEGAGSSAWLERTADKS